MDTDAKSWDKRAIEVPPGWHAAMKRLSVLTGMSVKYLYALALDRLMSDADLDGMADAASKLQRMGRRNLQDLSALHTADTLNKRYEKRSKRRGRKL